MAVDYAGEAINRSSYTHLIAVPMGARYTSALPFSGLRGDDCGDASVHWASARRHVSLGAANPADPC